MTSSNNDKVVLTVWTFRSESKPGALYQTLLYSDGTTSCDCKGWTFKRKTTANGARTCKHTRFVDSGMADVHAAARKDYKERESKVQLSRNVGRKFDFET